MKPPFPPGPFWLIGCGNMAGAMLEGWLAKGADPAQFTVIRPSGKAVAPGVRVLRELPEDEVPALLMLGVKPQKLDEVAPIVTPAMEPETILVSILAGVGSASLKERFPGSRTIVRAMPNTPVALNKGVVGLYSDAEDRDARHVVTELMAVLGLAEWIEDEGLFDVLSALSGSGPAFVFRFIDALSAGAESLGLPGDQARRLALATVEGAGALAAGAKEAPGQLADRVASPGGMTRKGLDLLDNQDRLRTLIRETLEAAVRRGREMGEEARRG